MSPIELSSDEQRWERGEVSYIRQRHGIITNGYLEQKKRKDCQIVAQVVFPQEEKVPITLIMS